MSRSVVLAGTPRCDGCLLPPRWCVCHALPPVESPVRVHVLQHRREQWRPSSTGSLVCRVVTGSRITVFHRGLTRAEVLAAPDPAAKPPWILHPRGEAPDDLMAQAAAPDAPEVVLIDGSWTESGRMLQLVQGWGRPVRLNLDARSRYRLREQKGDGDVSTAEALIGLYGALGLAEAAELLRWHLELRVYVGLRSRGRKAEAEEYLAQSPIRTRLASFLGRLHERRPNVASLPDGPCNRRGFGGPPAVPTAAVVGPAPLPQDTRPAAARDPGSSRA